LNQQNVKPNFPNNNPFPVIEESAGSVLSATGAQTWVEDVYGAGAWIASDAPVASDFIGLAASHRRLGLFFICLMGFLAVLLGRTGYLMAQSGSFKARSDSNRIRSIPVPAARGIIFDRNGVQLTDNVPDLQLAVVPADLPTDPEARSYAVSAIAALSGATPEAAEQVLADYPAKSYEPVTIAERVTRDQAIALTIAKNDYPAIRITPGSHRYYSLSNTVTSLSHILGYMGRIRSEDIKNVKSGNYQPTDAIGRTGLEYQYESQLRGVPGVKKVEVDAIGNEVGQVGQEEPVSGKNLRLSIDEGLSAASEAALQKMLDKTKQKRGAAIVEDVRNGEILALVSLPAYSNNRFSEGISSAEYQSLLNDPNHPLFSRAISGTYPPGSTAKLIVASAALAENVVTPKTTVNSVGGIMYGGQWWFPDWKAGGHGITDVRRAIAWSVNTFFYMVGGGYESFQGLGIDRLVKYFKVFGLGQKLGIDIPNEASGFVPTPEWKAKTKKEVWYIGDTYHVSIGQGDLLVTPLQMAAWTSTIANGGTIWQPHLAQAFVDDKGSVIEQVNPKANAEKVVDEKYLSTVRAGMRDTVVSGSAQSLKGIPMEIAGKTGTAQVSGLDNHAWFTGFGPYSDPKISVTVLLEEGKEGSTTSVPVAGEIFAWYAANRLNK
jgi:penicillin-binding protein 2